MVVGCQTQSENRPLIERGYVYDSETGLYYLQSRYYDPEVGRFLNTDSVDYIGYSGEQLSYNAFAYCESCPVNYKDVSGKIPYNLNRQIALSSDSHPKDEPPDHPDFKEPKKGTEKVKNPNGKGKGWVDQDGGVWVWDEKMHGGKGWTVQYPNGHHKHAYPGGKVRNHFQTEDFSGNKILTAIILAAFIALLIADNSTIIGFADDPIIIALGSCFINLTKTKMVCSVCGEVLYV